MVGLAFLGQFLLSYILAVGLTFTFLGPPALGPDPRLSPSPGAQPRSQVRQCQGQVAGSPAAASSEAIHPLSPTSWERSRGTLVKVWWRWSLPSQLDDLSFFIGEVKPCFLCSLCFSSSHGHPPTRSLSPHLGFPGGLLSPFFPLPVLLSHSLPANCTGTQLSNSSPGYLALQISLVTEGNKSGSCVNAFITSSLTHRLQKDFFLHLYSCCYTLGKLIEV